MQQAEQGSTVFVKPVREALMGHKLLAQEAPEVLNFYSAALYYLLKMDLQSYSQISKEVPFQLHVKLYEVHETARSIKRETAADFCGLGLNLLMDRDNSLQGKKARTSKKEYLVGKVVLEALEERSLDLSLHIAELVVFLVKHDGVTPQLIVEQSVKANTDLWQHVVRALLLCAELSAEGPTRLRLAEAAVHLVRVDPRLGDSWFQHGGVSVSARLLPLGHDSWILVLQFLQLSGFPQNKLRKCIQQIVQFCPLLFATRQLDFVACRLGPLLSFDQRELRRLTSELEAEVRTKQLSSRLWFNLALLRFAIRRIVPRIELTRLGIARLLFAVEERVAQQVPQLLALPLYCLFLLFQRTIPENRLVTCASIDKLVNHLCEGIKFKQEAVSQLLRLILLLMKVDPLFHSATDSFIKAAVRAEIKGHASQLNSAAEYSLCSLLLLRLSDPITLSPQVKFMDPASLLNEQALFPNEGILASNKQYFVSQFQHSAARFLKATRDNPCLQLDRCEQVCYALHFQEVECKPSLKTFSDLKLCTRVLLHLMQGEAQLEPNSIVPTCLALLRAAQETQLCGLLLALLHRVQAWAGRRKKDQQLEVVLTLTLVMRRFCFDRRIESLLADLVFVLRGDNQSSCIRNFIQVASQCHDEQLLRIKLIALSLELLFKPLDKKAVLEPMRELYAILSPLVSTRFTDLAILVLVRVATLGPVFRRFLTHYKETVPLALQCIKVAQSQSALHLLVRLFEKQPQLNEIGGGPELSEEALEAESKQYDLTLAMTECFPICPALMDLVDALPKGLTQQILESLTAKKGLSQPRLGAFISLLTEDHQLADDIASQFESEAERIALQALGKEFDYLFQFMSTALQRGNSYIVKAMDLLPMLLRRARFILVMPVQQLLEQPETLRVLEQVLKLMVLSIQNKVCFSAIDHQLLLELVRSALRKLLPQTPEAAPPDFRKKLGRPEPQLRVIEQSLLVLYRLSCQSRACATQLSKMIADEDPMAKWATLVADPYLLVMTARLINVLERNYPFEQNDQKFYKEPTNQPFLKDPAKFTRLRTRLLNCQALYPNLPLQPLLSEDLVPESLETIHQLLDKLVSLPSQKSVLEACEILKQKVEGRREPCLPVVKLLQTLIIKVHALNEPYLARLVEAYVKASANICLPRQLQFLLEATEQGPIDMAIIKKGLHHFTQQYLSRLLELLLKKPLDAENLGAIQFLFSSQPPSQLFDRGFGLLAVHLVSGWSTLDQPGKKVTLLAMEQCVKEDCFKTFFAEQELDQQLVHLIYEEQVFALKFFLAVFLYQILPFAKSKNKELGQQLAGLPLYLFELTMQLPPPIDSFFFKQVLKLGDSVLKAGLEPATSREFMAMIWQVLKDSRNPELLQSAVSLFTGLAREADLTLGMECAIKNQTVLEHRQILSSVVAAFRANLGSLGLGREFLVESMLGIADRHWWELQLLQEAIGCLQQILKGSLISSKIYLSLLVRLLLSAQHSAPLQKLSLLLFDRLQLTPEILLMMLEQRLPLVLQTLAKDQRFSRAYGMKLQPQLLKLCQQQLAIKRHLVSSGVFQCAMKEYFAQGSKQSSQLLALMLQESRPCRYLRVRFMRGVVSIRGKNDHETIHWLKLFQKHICRDISIEYYEFVVGSLQHLATNRDLLRNDKSGLQRALLGSRLQFLLRLTQYGTQLEQKAVEVVRSCWLISKAYDFFKQGEICQQLFKKSNLKHLQGKGALPPLTPEPGQQSQSVPTAQPPKITEPSQPALQARLVQQPAKESPAKDDVFGMFMQRLGEVQKLNFSKVKSIETLKQGLRGRLFRLDGSSKDIVVKLSQSQKQLEAVAAEGLVKDKYRLQLDLITMIKKDYSAESKPFQISVFVRGGFFSKKGEASRCLTIRTESAKGQVKEINVQTAVIEDKISFAESLQSLLVIKRNKL